MTKQRKIKRYLVFCWDAKTPTDSKKEIDSDFDSLEDALFRAVQMSGRFDVAEIYDTVEKVFLFQKVFALLHRQKKRMNDKKLESLNVKSILQTAGVPEEPKAEYKVAERQVRGIMAKILDDIEAKMFESLNHLKK